MGQSSATQPTGADYRTIKDGPSSTPLQTLPPDFCNHLMYRYARTSYRALVRFCLPLVVAL